MRLNFPGNIRISFSVIRWMRRNKRKTKLLFPSQGFLAGVATHRGGLLGTGRGGTCSKARYSRCGPRTGGMAITWDVVEMQSTVGLILDFLKLNLHFKIPR